MSIYSDKGFESRRDYLKSLVKQYNVCYADVLELAVLLGPGEDFDGLPSSLEDFNIFKQCQSG